MHRMLFVLLLAPLLSAGDRDVLEGAVELFRSDRPATRAEGSRLAVEEMRKLLAPVLKAMEDKDPEVRRRARRAILTLVPRALEEEPRQKDPRMRMPQFQVAWKLAQANRAQLRLVLVNGLLQMHMFGVNGAPHARGFRLTSVKIGGRAAQLGLKVGDILLSINDQPMSDAHSNRRIAPSPFRS